MIRLPALVFAAVAVALAQNDNMDMMGIINVLYLKADADLDGKITKTELGKIYENMDHDANGIISKSEFTHLWKLITGYNQEVVEAYFFLADLDGNGFLDSTDNDDIYGRFDLNGDGVVQAQEFLQKYKQVYYEVPFVVIFERVEKANTNDQHMDKAEFSTLFTSLSTSGGRSVRKADFVKSWTDNKFGSKQDAEKIFEALDTNRDNIISQSEVGATFASLDANGNGTIEILEAIALANKMVH